MNNKNKKKKVSKIKSSKKIAYKSPKKISSVKTNNLNIRKKAFGDPTPVIPITKKDYPKLIFNKDSVWHKIQRFFGYLP